MLSFFFFLSVFSRLFVMGGKNRHHVDFFVFLVINASTMSSLPQIIMKTLLLSCVAALVAAQDNPPAPSVPAPSPHAPQLAVAGYSYGNFELLGSLCFLAGMLCHYHMNTYIPHHVIPCNATLPILCSPCMLYTIRITFEWHLSPQQVVLTFSP